MKPGEPKEGGALTTQASFTPLQNWGHLPACFLENHSLVQ